MAKVLFKELSSPGCHNCKALEEFWHSVEKDFPDVTYQNVSILTPEGQELAVKYGIFASPGVILNDELFSTGGVDKEKFTQKIKELVQK